MLDVSSGIRVFPRAIPRALAISRLRDKIKRERERENKEQAIDDIRELTLGIEWHRC
jgi:hypothetical protein